MSTWNELMTRKFVWKSNDINYIRLYSKKNLTARRSVRTHV